MKTPVILLACGCFNPVTNMHLRMFEIARDYLHRMGQYEVIGGIISPVHDGYKKKDLEAGTHRLNMIKVALQENDWVKVSDWELKQESWTRTRHLLQHHQNHINAYVQSENSIDINEEDLRWMPDNIRKKSSPANRVVVKLLCGADLLESFGTPGLWADEDIEAIVGQHGLVVITRSNVNPAEFIYNSDLLTKYMPNISIVTEWIQNEISSTKIRRALRRSESVKYLIPDKVIGYIHKHSLYGSHNIKYLNSPSSIFLTPSPIDMNTDIGDSPTPTNCLYICNNNIFNSNPLRFEGAPIKHPGQAVKIVQSHLGKFDVSNKNQSCSKHHQVGIINDIGGEGATIKSSKSCTSFADSKVRQSGVEQSGFNLKECKSCDENLIKFIYTKHGIQVISDVETIV